MPYPNLPHGATVAAAVRELRSELGLTQQALAVEMETALTTIARWETKRSPRGRTLKDLADRAEQAGRKDLVAVFRKQLMRELGVALRSQFRYAVRHQRQAQSGAEALREVVALLRAAAELHRKPNLTTDEFAAVTDALDGAVQTLEILVAAAEPIAESAGLQVTWVEEGGIDRLDRYCAESILENSSCRMYLRGLKGHADDRLHFQTSAPKWPLMGILSGRSRLNSRK